MFLESDRPDLVSAEIRRLLIQYVFGHIQEATTNE